MTRKHCGKFRNRDGEVVTPPQQHKGGGESVIEHMERYNAWCRRWPEIGITNSRCACDPDHPHRPKDN